MQRNINDRIKYETWYNNHTLIQQARRDITELITVGIVGRGTELRIEIEENVESGDQREREREDDKVEWRETEGWRSGNPISNGSGIYI